MRECIVDEPEIVNKHPPSWKSVYQPTALAYAVWGNQPSAVRLLLESGANPNLADGVRARRNAFFRLPRQPPAAVALASNLPAPPRRPLSLTTRHAG